VATATSAETALHPQLAEIRQELQQVTAQVRRFVESCGAETWARKPSAKGWSPAECIMHLNMTSEIALPLLRDAIREARRENRVSAGPYKIDFVGRLVLRFTEPPYRLRAPSPASYLPSEVAPVAAVLAKFTALQRELLEVVDAANGLALTRIKVAWPVYVRLKYNMFSSLKMIPAHQRRHMWQAEQAARMPA